MTPLLQQYVLDHLLMGRVTHIEALELLALLPDASIDAIITDLPYGTTQSHFDIPIPFAPMWAGVKRVLKQHGVFVTTAAQPFSSLLVTSNLEMFKYEWVIVKQHPKGFLDARRKPLEAHEVALVFSEGQPRYYPQDTKRVNVKSGRKNKGGSGVYGKVGNPDYVQEVGNFPRSVLSFDWPTQDILHPNQKPVALYRYLVRTYTRPGDLVLDFCCGSATTGMACREEGRKFVLGERDADIAATAQARLDAPWTMPMFLEIAS